MKSFKRPLRENKSGKRPFRRDAVFNGFLPLAVFAFALVLLPLIYMTVLSFMRREGAWGVAAEFTFRNYRRIFEPVYLATFVQSLRLAFFSTLLTAVLGYPFGYFMARLSPVWK